MIPIKKSKELIELLKGISELDCEDFEEIFGKDHDQYIIKCLEGQTLKPLKLLFKLEPKDLELMVKKAEYKLKKWGSV